MSGRIHGISYFPNCPDKLVTWGKDVALYDIKPRKTATEETEHANAIRPPSFQCFSKSVEFLTSENRYQYVRCVRPSYHLEPMVALGLVSGKIGISRFDPCSDTICEFSPKQQRTCLCLDWNMSDKSLLAVGHDRNRSDFCITIWDVEKGLAKDSTQFMGLTETCHSLCWDKGSRVLIAGMSQKNIKIFDLRQSTTCTSIQTRTVHGLSLAPNGYYICSYVDSRIGLWDLRNIEKPLTPLMTTSNVFDISWCPTRSSLLSFIDQDSIYLNMTDVTPVEFENDREVFNQRRSFIPFNSIESKLPTGKPLQVYDIAWHPQDFEQALVLSENGIIADFVLPPTVAISWSNTNDLAKFCDLDFTFSQIQSSSHGSFSDDIAEIIRARSQNNYGLLTDIKKNGDLAGCSELKKLWYILANLSKEEKIMVGLKSILGIGTNIAIDMFANNFETFQIPWPDFFNNPVPLIYYKSEGRKQAKKMCGWSFEDDMEEDSQFINQLKANKEFSRAAMICVFHMKIYEACDILSKAADDSDDPSMFRIAAIALSGFNTRSTVWKSHRWHANKQIRDNHLRVMFFFLTVENQNYDGILYEKGICLADRIAFACRFLGDNKLGDFVKHCIASCMENGDLTGLILTGESSEGIRILQSYIDKYDDVQTPCLIAIRFFRSEVFQDKNVQSWIECYLELLDSWGLWEKRAELEIKMESLRSRKDIYEKTIQLLCNFCGKSVSTAMQEEARLRNSNVKSSTCPHCRKPLPRCTLCLLHIGTLTGENERKTKPFSKWFSWCQTCRHGGHTDHLMQWFSEHTECPESSCNCKCFSMDCPVSGTNC